MANILPLPPSTPPPLDEDFLGGSEEDEDFPPVTPEGATETFPDHCNHSLTETPSLRPYLIEDTQKEPPIFLKFAEKPSKKLEKELRPAVSISCENVIFHGTEQQGNLPRRACDTSTNPSNIPQLVDSHLPKGFASFDTAMKDPNSNKESCPNQEHISPVHMLHESKEQTFQVKDSMQLASKTISNCDSLSHEPVQNGIVVCSNDELDPMAKGFNSIEAKLPPCYPTLELAEQDFADSNSDTFKTARASETGLSHNSLIAVYTSESTKVSNSDPEFHLGRSSSEEFPMDGIGAVSNSEMEDCTQEDEEFDNFQYSSPTTADNEIQDDFGDFADFKMANMNDTVESPENWENKDVSSFDNEDDDEFADFESATFTPKVKEGERPSENFANFESAWSQDLEDECEFANFETASMILPQAEVAPNNVGSPPSFDEDTGLVDDFTDFKDALVSPSITSASGDTDKVPLIFQNAFPPLQELVLSELPTAPLLDGESLKLWSKLQESENGLSFSWPRSKAFRLVLSALSLVTPMQQQPQQQQSVPLFAVNLGLLEPIPASQTPSSSSVTPECEQVLPEPQQCEEDWNQQPLNLDFLDTGEEVQPVEDEVEEAAVPPKVSHLLSHLLAAGKPSNQEQLSTEARQVLERLSDLSFMTSPVLMFPISSS